MNRRQFMSAMIAAVASKHATSYAQAYGTFPLPLWLERNGEKHYFDAASTDGYAKAAYLLRDVQAKRQGHPTMTLLHQLSWINCWLALNWQHRPMIVHSGLRMPKTNASVEGAAQASLHLPNADLSFRAVDLHMEGVPAEYLGKLASVPKAGGVGIYPRHVHVDDGSVRQWRKDHYGRQKSPQKSPIF